MINYKVNLRKQSNRLLRRFAPRNDYLIRRFAPRNDCLLLVVKVISSFGSAYGGRFT